MIISAVTRGVRADLTPYLSAVLNGSAAVGRVLAVLLSRRFNACNECAQNLPIPRLRALGALNILIPYTAVAAVVTYAWPYAHGIDPFVAVAACYG
jgi:MFS transporter, MCT family, solute carrier family 16 (monocarboxylic acid transporters), member 10